MHGLTLRGAIDWCKRDGLVTPSKISSADSLILMKVEPDFTYKIIEANADFLSLTGMTQQDLADKNVNSLLSSSFAFAFLSEKYWEAITSEHPVTYRRKGSFPEGELVFETTIIPLFEKPGACTYLLSVATQVSGPLTV